MSHSVPPLLSRQYGDNPATASRSIPTLPSSGSGSSFRAPSSSISRKKPKGLDVSASIPKPSRSAPGLPGNEIDLNTSSHGGGIGKNGFGMTEAERLREDIARLQLSSKSSSTSLSSGSNSNSNPSKSLSTGSNLPSPTTPTHLTAMSDSSSSSIKKKSSSGDKEKGKSKSSSNKKSKDKDREGLDLVKDEDLEIICDLGSGNGGTVTKVWNKKRKCIMARKLILVDAKPSIRKQILRELQIMNDCSSPYIVDYYGCFSVDVHVGIAMEAMDAGSLDYIYRSHGPIPIDIVGKVAEAVLNGLIYLYDVHRIIHRDIKPSNILANTNGEIKICDFGVSGELINSIANTFVGTSTYMSPERIKGATYTIKSDVWSLGISLIELALGRFPFSDSPDSASEASADEDDMSQTQHDPDATLPLSTQRPKLKSVTSSTIQDGDGEGKKKKKKKGVSLGGGGHTMSILDLLQHIVNEPAPKLVSNKRVFPNEAVDFVEGCLDKDPMTRTSPQDLLTSLWITSSKVTKEDLRSWAVGVADRDGDNDDEDE